MSAPFRVALQRVAGCLAALALFSSTSLAQQQDETERKIPAQEVEHSSTATKAATAAKTQAALDLHEPVTYAQILADPDNIDLNFRYAKTQVAQGDVRGAAATLERILLINPDLARVKLFYGVVLFRLDNLDEAERTLKAVREMDMSASLRSEVDQYLGEIRHRRRRTHVTDSLSLGYQFDTNRNAAPSSKTRLFGDTPLTVSGTSRQRRDTSVLVINSLEVLHDLGFQAGHQLYGGFDYFLGEQTAIDDLDLQSFALRLGGILKTWLAQATVGGFAEHIMLSRETFLRSQGVEARLDRDLTKKLRLFVSNRFGREDFSGINENAAAPERRGDRDTFLTGAGYALTPSMRVSGSLGYERKGAKTDYNSYDGFVMSGSHLWLLGKGQFLINSVSYGLNSYDGPDRAISAKTRQDRQFRARLTYGVPSTLFLGRWADNWALKDITATVTFEYFRSLSNITNYTYRNFKSTTMLTKRVEF